jgi:Putative restriction endonuclease
MAEPKKSPATYADIEALQPHIVGEILFGILHTQPRPTIPHAAALSGLGFMLGGPFQLGRGGPGGWIILDEPELHLGPHVVVPDVAGWKTERLAGKMQAKWLDIAPDWVCEILSDSTRARDKRDKMRIYATYGVAFVWQLDPVVRVLEIYKRQDQDWLLVKTFLGQDTVAAPPFETLSFTLNDLWPFDAPVAEN